MRERSEVTEQWRSSLIKNYRPCNSCGNARHKDSSSGLCHECYWKERRAASSNTGLTRAEYDARRYDSSKRRDSYLRKKYGISLADYDALVAEQDDMCAICGASPDNRNSNGCFTHGGFVVDHCHATGAVRGLLCDKCNKGLGQFNDNLDLIRKAVAYLEGNN